MSDAKIEHQQAPKLELMLLRHRDTAVVIEVHTEAQAAVYEQLGYERFVPAAQEPEHEPKAVTKPLKIKE